jgi:hypothetical protein
MVTIKSEAAPEIMEIMLLTINHKMKNLWVMQGMQVTDLGMSKSNRNSEETTMERGGGVGYASVGR